MLIAHEISTGIKLDDRKLGVIFAQPHLRLVLAGNTYRLEQAFAAVQRQTIREILASVTKDSPAQFLAFPEYSVPEDMVPEADQKIRADAWPRNTAVLAGLEGLQITAFEKLLSQSNNPEKTRTVTDKTSTFANVAVIWTKNNEGDVQFYVQPKLKPSGPEQATQGMYEGNHFLLFTTNRLSFGCLICFDSIAAVGPFAYSAEALVQALTRDVPDGNSKNLNLLFLLQHNDRPEHPEFIQFAQKVLQEGGDKLNTGQKAAVSFVNSAHAHYGRAREENFGRSALYYVQRGNWIEKGENGPLSVIPSTFALENSGNGLVRTRFREDGPSVHTFSFYIPSQVGSASGDVKYPIGEAGCQKIHKDGSLATRETPSSLQKVFLDWLPDHYPPGDARFNCSHAQVKALAEKAYLDVRQQVASAGDTQHLEQIVNLLLVGFRKPTVPAAMNPDKWQKQPSNWYANSYGQALLEFTSVCLCLSIEAQVDLSHSDHLCSGRWKDRLFTILDGKGEQSWEDLWSTYWKWLSANSWAETIGLKNMIFPTRVAQIMPAASLKRIQVTFTEYDVSESGSLPEGVRSKIGDFLDTSPEFYVLAATTLRSVLTQPDEAHAKDFLRETLDTAH